MKLPFLIPALAAAAFASAAPAQQGPTRDEGNEKINQVLVYGDQECPVSKDDEILVCARMKDDPDRIPEALRGNPDAPQNQAWGARASSLEYQGRAGIGSCSPSGSGGATGCFNQLVRQARAERRDTPNWVALVEAKREERLGKIDEKSDAIEARVKAEEADKKAADAKAPE